MFKTAVFGTAGAVVALASISFASPAAADSASYLQELDRVGVKYTDDAMDAMVKIGVAACNDLRAGDSLPRVGANVANSGLGMEPSLSVVLAATHNLCPEFHSQTLRTAIDNGWVKVG